jgi:5,10-methylenetetrahydromethanopterin reductase
MKVSFAILPDHPVEEILETIELGDRLGFYAAYLADEVFHQDAWQLLGAAARRTERIRLVPVTHVVLREPTYVAQQLLTLDALSDGRAAALYSIGNVAMLKQYGYNVADLKMIGRLREAHHVLRTFLDAGEIEFDGKFFHYDRVFTSARARQPRIQLTMGGIRGPKTFELAGEISDGIMTGLAYSHEALEYALDCVKRGAERGGREWTSLDIGAGLIGTISADGEAAREVARVMAAFYLPAMGDETARRHGIDPERLAPVRAEFARGDVDAAIRLAPQDVTDRLIMPVGTPAEWIEQLRALGPLGYNHVCVTPIDTLMVRKLVDLDLPAVPSVSEQLQLIHDQVLPGLAARSATGDFVER